MNLWTKLIVAPTCDSDRGSSFIVMYGYHRAIVRFIDVVNLLWCLIGHCHRHSSVAETQYAEGWTLSVVSGFCWSPRKHPLQTRGRLLCVYCLLYRGVERIEGRILGTLRWFLLQMARSLLQKA